MLISPFTFVNNCRISEILVLYKSAFYHKLRLVARPDISVGQK